MVPEDKSKKDCDHHNPTKARKTMTYMNNSGGIVPIKLFPKSSIDTLSQIKCDCGRH